MNSLIRLVIKATDCLKLHLFSLNKSKSYFVYYLVLFLFIISLQKSLINIYFNFINFHEIKNVFKLN
jgi:hypothetical protein